MKPTYTIVPKVTPESMRGDSLLEKKINAFVTTTFIGTTELPDDECLSEAKHIIKHKLDEEGIKMYLMHQFEPSARQEIYGEAAKAIAEMMK